MWRGEIGSKVAEELGLKPGTPVVVGGGDGACATAGGGNFPGGQLLRLRGLLFLDRLPFR